MDLNNVNINWIWFLTHFSYTNFGAQLCLEFSQVDPLNLELYNHAKHISVVLTISPIKIWGKPVKGFIRYDETFPNIPTEISTLYIQHSYILIIIIQCFFTVRGAKLEKKTFPTPLLSHITQSLQSLYWLTPPYSLILKMMNVSVELAYRVSWIYKTNVSHHFQILKEWKNCRNYRIFSSFQGWHDFKDIIKWNHYQTALLT